MKLPINPLLYLLSLACTAGIGWSVWDLVHPKEPLSQRWEGTMDKFKVSWKKGQGVLGDDTRWIRDSSRFWRQFGVANFTGYVKPAPVIVDNTGPDKNEKTDNPDLDLKTIVRVIAMTYGKDHTTAIIQYLSDVTVPEELVGNSSGPVSSPLDTIPKGQRNKYRNRPVPMPSSNMGNTPLHHMKLQEKLWPPYHYVHLVAVGSDAESVTFEIRKSDEAPEGGYEKQEVLRNELGLPDDVLERLRSYQRSLGDPGSEQQAKVATPTPPADDQWEDVPDTIYNKKTNRVNVSSKDHRELRSRGNEMLQDLGTEDVSFGSGASKKRGVAVKKVPERLRAFGVSNGDVLLSLNGQKVKGKAHAIKVGRRLYKDGVRTFQAEVLRRGQQITLTYHLDQ